MKKSLKLFLLALLINISLLICMPANVLATNNNEMTIYSINIGKGNHGDSTLVESNGEYLLMDLGVNKSYSYVNKFLSDRGITHFSLYISHFHGDHTGGFENDKDAPIYKLMQKYKIDHIYLPDPSLLKYKGKQVEIYEEAYYNKIKKYYESSSIQNKNYDNIVTYLKCGSKFSFGSVNASIIGPVGMNNFKSPLKNGATTISPNNINEDLLDDYQNNCSLVAKLVCGDISFLTAGDIKTDAENALINKYKNTNTLKSTIYKMSHHGLPPANSEKFLSYVKPDFSFVSNYANTGIRNSSKFWEIHSPQQNCGKYGFIYMGGNENKTLQIDVKNNKISLYRYGNSTKLNKPGWTKVVGGDGINRKVDYFYFGNNGYTLKGVQKIDGKYYYLGTGGYRHYGTGKGSNYRGMTTCSEDNIKRYFLNDDSMLVGFNKIKDKSYNGLYYFKKDGSLKTSTNNGWQKVKIGNYYYSIYKSGKISTNVFRKYNGGMCYFGSDGKMITGWKRINGKKYYLSKENGTRYTGLKKIKNNYYFFSDYGVLQTNKTKTIDGVKYIFDASGKMINVPEVKKAKISSLKTTKNKITVKWKKKSVDGYRIYISTSKNGKYKLAKTIKNSKTTSTVLKNLKKNTKYYVKIRSYKKLGNNYEYSDFSKVKSIKTKK